MTVKSLEYVVIKTENMEAWHHFLTDIVGAMPGRPRGDAALYRIDDRPFRFWIEPGESERLVASAFEVADSAALARLAAAVAAAGRPVRHASAEEARARGVEAMFATSDPAGNGLEFFSRWEEGDSEAFVSPVGVAGFVTGGMGMGHAVLPAPDFERCHAFYRDVIGFGDTDLPRFYLQGGEGDPGMGFAFMHGGGGRHHAVALAECPPPPSGCIHLMLEMATLIDVGRCHDRMRKAKIPESATLGRHVNDEMTSFYMQTPSGFDLEIGCDGLVIDPATWVPTAHEQISVWGHVWAWQNAMAE